MDSRDINRVEKCMGLHMFVFKDGSVVNATETAVSLFEEVTILRRYCDSETLRKADAHLDHMRSKIMGDQNG